MTSDIYCLSRGTPFPIILHVRLAKSQISLRKLIRVITVRLKMLRFYGYPKIALRREVRLRKCSLVGNAVPRLICFWSVWFYGFKHKWVKYKYQMTFLSYLRINVANIIQRHDKKFISFLIQFKNVSNWNFTGSQMPHFMLVLITYINLWNIFWIQMFIFKKYGDFN